VHNSSAICRRRRSRRPLRRNTLDDAASVFLGCHSEQTGDAKARIDLVDADAIAREPSLSQESG
jgi:hypothetical protein